MRTLLFVATMAIAGCGDSGSIGDTSFRTARERQVIRNPVELNGESHRMPGQARHDGLGGNWLADAYASLLDAPRSGSQEALRVRFDAARNRLWVLSLDHVYIYDIAERHLIQRIALPPWSVADLVCDPDLVLDRSGTAYISHNAEPRLWQINADNFQLREHVLRLPNGDHREIGFGGLTFAADGTLFGFSASGGSLWRIDVGNASAHEVPSGPHPAGRSMHPATRRTSSVTHERQ